MKLTYVFALIFLFNIPGVSAESDTLNIKVYKSPTCQCCNRWITHLEENGFSVDAVDVDSVGIFKKRLGVPRNLSSCHTAEVGHYIIEGHVSADDILRLLKEKPTDIKGLSVPGMPIGSPGMEGKNPQVYDVISFKKDGSNAVYSTHTP